MARKRAYLVPTPHPSGAKPPRLPVVPRHVALVMDGNGRWAKQRGLPRNQTADNLEFWTFPKDYEERLDQVMGELVQAAAARRAVEEDEANGVAQ